MEIKVLGTGSSGNCYRVSDGATTILLDAGLPLEKIRKGCGFALSQIAGCLVTHSHKDHCKAVPGLLKSGVPVWMPGEEIEAAKFPADMPQHRLHTPYASGFQKYEAFQIDTLTVVPFRVQHDTPEPVGYLIGSSWTDEKLLYITDSFYVGYQFRGVTHLICEVNYDADTLWERVERGETDAVRAKRLFISHMSLSTFLGFLRALDQSRLKSVLICHMSNDHGDERRILEAVQAATTATVMAC